MAGNTVIVRVLGNVSNLSRALKKAQADLGGLERINRNISSGFRTAAISAAVFGAASVASGTAGAAALAGVPVVLGAISVAAAAAGTGIVLGLGGALLGIGIAAAAQSEKVKKAFSGLKDSVAKDLQRMAEPLVPVLQKTAVALGNAFDTIAPSLEKVFKASVPVVQGFNKALEPIANNLAPAIVNAFKAAVPVFDAVTKGAVSISAGFAGMVKQLAKAAPAFAAFTTATMQGFANMLPAFGRFLGAVTPVATTVMNTVMPALTSMFNSLSKNIGPLFSKTVPILKAFGEALKSMGTGVKDAFNILLANSAGFETFIKALGTGVAALLPVVANLVVALTPIGTAILGVLVPALVSLGNTIAANVGHAFAALTGAISAHPTLFRNIAIAVLLFVAAIKAATLIIAVYNGILLVAGVATGTFSAILTAAAAVQRVFTAAAVGTRIALAALAVQTVVVRGAVIAWTAAQWLLNAALTANPIGLVIVAIAALVAAFIYAWRNSEKFRAIIIGSWNAIRTASITVWIVIKNAVVNAINAVRNAVVNGFNAVRNVVVNSWNAVRNVTVNAWNGIRNAVVNAVSGVRNAVSNGFNAVRNVISNAWNAARNLTSSAWAGIRNAVSNGMSGVRSVVTSGLSAVRSAISNAWNAARSATTSAWSAIRNAVSSGIATVMGLISALPGRITGVLSGLAGTMFGIGANIISSLASGISSMAGTVASAAASVVSNAVSAAKSALQINSPSRVFDRIGRQSGQGLVNGLRASRRSVGRAGRQMAEAARKGGRKAARDWNKKGLTKALIRTQKEIGKAKKGLKDLTKSAREYAKNIRVAAIDYGSVTNLNSAFTADAMLQQMKDRIKKVREYNLLLAGLVKSGLNKTMLRDLADAGVEGGLATATAIAAGGKKSIREFNTLQGQLGNAGKRLGKTTSNGLYKAGIQAGNGLVRGLNRKRKSLIKIARRMGDVLTKSLKKSLGIKSPSRVFKRLGEQTTKGLEVGLRDITGVKRAVVNIGDAMEKSFNRPSLEASARHGGGRGGDTINITVNVPVTANPAETGRQVAKALDEYYKQGGRRLAV